MMAFSMTKTLTAVAILQLSENGKLDLDDSIDRYILNNPYGKSITIRHLLSHTSGIPNPIPLKWAHLANRHEHFNEDSTLAEILEENSDPSLSRVRNMLIQIFHIGCSVRLLKTRAASPIRII